MCKFLHCYDLCSLPHHPNEEQALHRKGLSNHENGLIMFDLDPFVKLADLLLAFKHLVCKLVRALGNRLPATLFS